MIYIYIYIGIYINLDRAKREENSGRSTKSIRKDFCEKKNLRKDNRVGFDLRKPRT